jgi:hypothetical protein
LSDDDTIIAETTRDGDQDIEILISKTTMTYQETKSYFGGGSYLECILLPAEKASMMFEMLNTPQTTINGE